MSNYLTFMAEKKEKDIEKFFGEVKHVSNKYFTFNHVIDDGCIILITNNIVEVKGTPVLVVGSNKAVYLKDWQIRKAHNYDDGFNGYAVKLNRKFFKVYTFRSNFEGFSFEKDESFDDLAEAAKSQNVEKIALGHME